VTEVLVRKGQEPSLAKSSGGLDGLMGDGSLYVYRLELNFADRVSKAVFAGQRLGTDWGTLSTIAITR